jgi:solute carrier family 10 (sodium/bile acid cotransporter), member 7
MTRFRSLWSRLDPFLVAILLTVGLASLLPARGVMAEAADGFADAAVALLFFLHGARLSPAEALAGARDWRLHGMVLAGTFALFPLLGAAARYFVPGLLPAPLWPGLILLTALPSTVQASIVFTSVAGGNVAAAVCSASASSLLGIFLTPLIAGLLLSRSGVGLSLASLRDIVVQLLLPFVAGLALRPWIGGFVMRHARLVKTVDYGSILLIVYAAFSRGVVNGLWHEVDAAQLVRLALVDAALLASVLTILTAASRGLGFSRADEIAIVFCGSKKSLASGLPIANVLFAGHLGIIILPAMLFHQLQLMVCATLARRYRESGARLSRSAKRWPPSRASDPLTAQPTE